MSNSRHVRRLGALVLCAVAAVLLVSVSAGGRSSSARCSVRGLLPDRLCTPGATFAAAGAAEICRAGYSRSVRDVPYSLKRRIYSAYGVGRHPRGAFEVDHLIPLELGGSNAAANLWPEAAPGFHVKDRLENALHHAVCSGQLSLGVAQRQIARDWHAEWIRVGMP